MAHGVPEVAVLSETGKLLYSSRTKELELAVQRSDPGCGDAVPAAVEAGEGGVLDDGGELLRGRD